MAGSISRSESLKPLRILFLHNRYRTPGGEEKVVESEVRLLREAGHEVELLEARSDTISGAWKTMMTAWDLPQGRRMRDRVRKTLRSFRPDVLHAHNTFPLFSPSVFSEARTLGIRTVMTAHNFRIFCSNGLMLRDGKSCMECLDRSPWSGVQHRCYRSSAPQSLMMWRLIETHRKRGTWDQTLDHLVVLNSFAREIFLRFGFRDSQLTVVPNFTCEPSLPPQETREKSALYLGRWSSEKGLLKLLESWKHTGLREMELRIAGSGPEERAVEMHAERLRAEGFRVQVLGQLHFTQVEKELHQTSALLFPSLCHENFPLAIVEALAHSTPVLAPVGGPLGGILGEAALPIDPHAPSPLLGEQIRAALADAERLIKQGRMGRERYLANFTAQRHLERLEAVYRGETHG